MFNIMSFKSGQCSLSLNLAEKFKYLGIVFTSDGRQDEELDI